jgi:hypothetical protein
MPGPSSHEHSSSCLWNLATNSFITSTRELSLGNCPSTSSMTEDTAAQSVASSLIILVWQRAVARILAGK